MSNPELSPHAKHPQTGQFVAKHPVATGPGHVEQSSAEQAASIPGAGSTAHFIKPRSTKR